VKGEIKEGAGFVKEEMNEHGKSPESQRKAQEGRDLRDQDGREEGHHQDQHLPGLDCAADHSFTHAGKLAWETDHDAAEDDQHHDGDALPAQLGERQATGRPPQIELRAAADIIGQVVSLLLGSFCSACISKKPRGMCTAPGM